MTADLFQEECMRNFEDLESNEYLRKKASSRTGKDPHVFDVREIDRGDSVNKYEGDDYCVCCSAKMHSYAQYTICSPCKRTKMFEFIQGKWGGYPPERVEQEVIKAVGAKKRTRIKEMTLKEIGRVLKKNKKLKTFSVSLPRPKRLFGKEKTA